MSTRALVSASPWATVQTPDWDRVNFGRVFGVGDFDFIGWGSAHGNAAINTAAVFAPARRFVMLEGGFDADEALKAYLDANATAILAWVEAGGVLLLQCSYYGASLGTRLGDWQFGAGPADHGVLTSVGASALPGLSGAQLQGALLAQASIIAPQDAPSSYPHSIGTPPPAAQVLLNAYRADRPGTVFAAVAQAQRGAGWIIYSGLTVSRWHGAPLRYDEFEDEIPPPGDWALMDALITYADSLATAAPEVPAMTTYAWPAWLAHSACTLELVPNTRTHASPYSGSSQTVDLAGERWRMGIAIPPRLAVNAAALEAFLFRLRGVHTISSHYRNRPIPRGTLRGSPVLASAAAQGASQLVLTVAAGATVLAGDMLGAGGMLFMAAEDAAAAGATLTVQTVNRARNSIAAGAAVAWDKPAATWRLMDRSVPITTRLVYAEGLEFDLIEHWSA